jgi:N-acetylmuramoyl-L-alanine amidase
MIWAFETAARTLWQEARGEPLEGQRAVAHVLVNRLKSGRWGSTLAMVCLSPLQFSGWNLHDPNRMAAAALPDDDPTLVALGAVLQAAVDGEPDPTGGAMWYYAHSMATPPAWIQGATFCGRFGNQLFYKDVK